MARVPLKEVADLAPQDRELIWRRGNLYKALVNSPEFTQRFAAFGFWMNYASQIKPRVQELAILHVAYLLGCSFEWVAHIKKSVQQNILSEGDIAALKAAAHQRKVDLDPFEVAALRVARETVRDQAASAEAFAAMRAFTTDSYMVEFVGMLGMYIGLAHIIGTLDIDIAAEDLPWLDSYESGDGRSLSVHKSYAIGNQSGLGV